jgi:hypothetical protein
MISIALTSLLQFCVRGVQFATPQSLQGTDFVIGHNLVSNNTPPRKLHIFGWSIVPQTFVHSLTLTSVEVSNIGFREILFSFSLTDSRRYYFSSLTLFRCSSLVFTALAPGHQRYTTGIFISFITFKSRRVDVNV